MAASEAITSQLKVPLPVAISHHISSLLRLVRGLLLTIARCSTAKITSEDVEDLPASWRIETQGRQRKEERAAEVKANIEKQDDNVSHAGARAASIK